jgi:hypothetical protein
MEGRNMSRRSNLLWKSSLAVVGAAGAAVLGGRDVAHAQNQNLRVVVGLASGNAQIVPWFDDEYDAWSPNCKPAGGVGWWHCDDGAGIPAVDLLKGNFTVNESTTGCPTDQSVDIGGGVLRCGTPVWFQAVNQSPWAPLVAKVFDHGTSCSGVSVRIYKPEDQNNAIARFEFVHMSEGQIGQTFLITSGWTVFELGRVKHPDCISTGAHLHQSGGPEGSVLSKNSNLMSGCTLGQYCSISNTSDSTNKWTHNIFWQTTPPPTPTPTPPPGGGGGGGCKGIC